MKLESIPVNLHDLCKNCEKLISPLVSEKGIEAIVSFKSDCGEFFICDPTRLKQVILNLLNNSIKFTSKGSVQLNLKISKIDTAYANIECKVKDTGIGIAQERLTSIFSAFEQADSSTTRKFGGTGLGLSICQKIISLLGSEIHVTSHLGKGSEFNFNLKLPVADSSSLKKAAQATQTPDLSKFNILLCEDNKTNSKILSKILHKTNCTVICAFDGKEALELIRNNSYDLILMDMQMPYYSGLEVTRIIKEEKNPFTTPIIALTANVMDDDRAACFKVGMQEFLTKPINRQILFATLENYLLNRSNDKLI
jgi:CheY-like chemotaxis protein